MHRDAYRLKTQFLSIFPMFNKVIVVDLTCTIGPIIMYQCINVKIFISDSCFI